jgi:LysM repeat protein
LAAAVLIVIALMAAAWISGSREVERVPTTTHRVTVGDTLWSLARQYPVEGLTTGQTVELLQQVNDLDGATIVAGTCLRVPSDGVSDERLAMR